MTIPYLGQFTAPPDPRLAKLKALIASPASPPSPAPDLPDPSPPDDRLAKLKALLAADAVTPGEATAAKATFGETPAGGENDFFQPTVPAAPRQMAATEFDTEKPKATFGSYAKQNAAGLAGFGLKLIPDVALQTGRDLARTNDVSASLMQGTPVRQALLKATEKEGGNGIPSTGGSVFEQMQRPIDEGVTQLQNMAVGKPTEPSDVFGRKMGEIEGQVATLLPMGVSAAERVLGRVSREMGAIRSARAAEAVIPPVQVEPPPPDPEPLESHAQPNPEREPVPSTPLRTAAEVQKDIEGAMTAAEEAAKRGSRSLAMQYQQQANKYIRELRSMKAAEPVVSDEELGDETPATAQAIPGAVPQDLRTAMRAVGDAFSTPEGYMPVHQFTPDEQRQIENAGIRRETVTSQSGESYEGYGHGSMWDLRDKVRERLAAQEKAESERKGPPPPPAAPAPVLKVPEEEPADLVAAPAQRQAAQAAFRVGDQIIPTGSVHRETLIPPELAGLPVERGFVTKAGEFLTPEQAGLAAKKKPTAAEILGKTDAEMEQILHPSKGLPEGVSTPAQRASVEKITNEAMDQSAVDQLVGEQTAKPADPRLEKLKQIIQQPLPERLSNKEIEYRRKESPFGKLPPEVRTRLSRERMNHPDAADYGAAELWVDHMARDENLPIDEAVKVIRAKGYTIRPEAVEFAKKQRAIEDAALAEHGISTEIPPKPSKKAAKAKAEPPATDVSHASPESVFDFSKPTGRVRVIRTAADGTKYEQHGDAVGTNGRFVRVIFRDAKRQGGKEVLVDSDMIREHQPDYYSGKEAPKRKAPPPTTTAEVTPKAEPATDPEVETLVQWGHVRADAERTVADKDVGTDEFKAAKIRLRQAEKEVKQLTKTLIDRHGEEKARELVHAEMQRNPDKYLDALVNKKKRPTEPPPVPKRTLKPKAPPPPAKPIAFRQSPEEMIGRSTGGGDLDLLLRKAQRLIDKANASSDPEELRRIHSEIRRGVDEAGAGDARAGLMDIGAAINRKIKKLSVAAPEPERITAAVIRFPDGTEVEGGTHATAFEKATGKQPGDPVARDPSLEYGFRTSSGRFVTKEEAGRIGQARREWEARQEEPAAKGPAKLKFAGVTGGNPKFRKMDNDALIARRHELIDRIDEQNKILDKNVTPFARERDDGSVVSGTSVNQAAGRAIGQIKTAGRILGELDAEFKVRGITDEHLADALDARTEREAMQAEENIKPGENPPGFTAFSHGAVGGGLVGAAAGAEADKKHPGRGALIGAIAGAIAGGKLGAMGKDDLAQLVRRTVADAPTAAEAESRMEAMLAQAEERGVSREAFDRMDATFRKAIVRRYQQEGIEGKQDVTLPSWRRPGGGALMSHGSVGGGIVGAAAGVQADKKHPGRGALIGAIAGAALGTRLTKVLAANPVTAGKLITPGIKDDILTMLAPASRGGGGEEAGYLMRHRLGEEAASEARARESLRGFRRIVAHLSKSDAHRFIDHIEQGQIDLLPKPLQPIALALRKVLDETRDEIIALGNGRLTHYYETYFPHIWKDPDKARDVIKQILGKRPLEGNKNFLRKRSIMSVSEGLDAGLELATDNPLDLVLLKHREMRRYLMGQRVLNDFKEEGLAKFVKAREAHPDGYRRIDDRVAEVRGPGPKGSITIRGHYWAPEPVARVINNHLSPGLRGRPLYDGYMYIGNLMNQVQLGLSMFHLGFTSLDAAVSKVALGILEAKDLHPIKAAKAFAEAPIAPYTNFRRGAKLRRAYLDGVDDPIVQGFIEGGGRVQMDNFWRTNAAESFLHAVQDRNPVGIAKHAIPAVFDASSKFVLDYVVPRQKLGVFADLYSRELAKLPADATPMMRKKIASKVWDSVDNRMGQMVYDNLFWNRTLKDLAFASVRSVGWNLGTIRELGGGVLDLSKGQMTPRASYAIALPITVGLMGAVTTYLYTGHGPQSLKDYFLPPTGKVNEDGNQERVQLPSYVKDVIAYQRHPLETLGHKAQPFLATIIDMLKNKDYYGDQIRNRNDPVVQQAIQAATYLGKQFIPFGIRNAMQERTHQQSTATKVGPFFGMTPAPRELVRSPAQQKMAEILGDRGFPSRTPEEVKASGTRQTMLEQFREGKLSKQQISDSAKAGVISHRQALDMQRRGTEPNIVQHFKSLTYQQAEDVYSRANGNERALWWPILWKKRMGALDQLLDAGNKTPQVEQLRALIHRDHLHGPPPMTGASP